MSASFRIALTADFFESDGTPRSRDFGLGVFQSEPRIAVLPLEKYAAEIEPQQLAGARAVLVLVPRVTADTLSGNEDLLAVARFGVGYDSVDVAACTAADVAVLIAAGAVDRSVAEATVAWMFALTHHVRSKDILVREGRWNDRTRYVGSELRQRTLGVIGLGGIGHAVVELLRGFGMNRPLAYDPFVDPAAAAELGVELVALDELLRRADFVSLHCPLNESTRNLIGACELGLMKPDAWLINTARGGIVDEDALEAALEHRKIAGAALDCFAGEPLTQPYRLARFEQVLLAPHCIAWTAELSRDVGNCICQSLLDLAQGRRPRGLVNPEVLQREGFQAKWARLRLA